MGRIAKTTGIALKDVRYWLETLEAEDLIQVARTEAGLSASINAKGRLALGQFRPFSTTMPDRPFAPPQTTSDLPETGGAPEGSVEPPLPTRFFTGRGDVLQQLDRALQHNSTVALSGMPGVGKTQIALQFARSHKGVYQPIYWAVAASRDTLAAGYAAIAWRLDLPEKSQKDQTLVNNGVRRWLREHEGWLLILDNADDLEAVQALLPPSDHRGHLLLTTRESAFFPEAEPVPIEQMPEDDGATFLLHRARRSGGMTPWNRPLRRTRPRREPSPSSSAACPWPWNTPARTSRRFPSSRRTS